DTWYAQPTINFGQAGISQKWANILGNVSSDIIIDTLTYEVNNNGLKQKLPLGSDGFDFRLENKGDFNIEIDHTTLEPGPNSVTIRAKDTQGQITTKTVTINYSPADIGLPSAYITDWGSLGNDIQKVEDIAHVVDGLWNLTADGIRTKEDGYDRAISIGDMNWLSNNYEVTVPFILHSDFTGIGFGVGWQGHEVNDHELLRSPKVGWPLQSLVWIRGAMERSTLEILTYKGKNSTPKEWELPVGTKKPLAPLILNQQYWLKSYSKPLSNSMSRFYAKFWKDGDGEPDSWMINADVSTRDGSILLVAYEADVTFGNVSVNERRTDPSEDTTSPVISGIKVAKTDSVVTISWETDKPSNSVVEYGLTNSYGLNKTDSSQTKMHSLSLTGLNSNVEYHFRVKSADTSNNTTSSEDKTFFISASTYKLPRNEWHLISLPMNPSTKNKVSDIFGKDDLGKYGTSWAVFHYDASNNHYVDLGLNGEMEQGMGYWIIQMTSMSKTLGMPVGSQTTPSDVSGKFEIPLVTKDGSSQFNMIGYPFNTNGHFKDARIETNEAPCESDTGCTKDIDYAKNNNILHNELWTYSGGSGYIKINTTNGNLDPWQGFWAETLSGADGKEPSLLFSKPENSNN
ncbi:MAG: fibronectin type III domain-containing protein, partial [Methylococcaceae bacterium]